MICIINILKENLHQERPRQFVRIGSLFSRLQKRKENDFSIIQHICTANKFEGHVYGANFSTIRKQFIRKQFLCPTFIRNGSYVTANHFNFVFHLVCASRYVCVCV